MALRLLLLDFCDFGHCNRCETCTQNAMQNTRVAPQNMFATQGILLLTVEKQRDLNLIAWYPRSKWSLEPKNLEKISKFCPFSFFSGGGHGLGRSHGRLRVGPLDPGVATTIQPEGVTMGRQVRSGSRHVLANEPRVTRETCFLPFERHLSASFEGNHGIGLSNL